MTEAITVAALQLTSTPDREANRRRAFALIDEAVAAGARFVATPENTDAIAPKEERFAKAEALDGPLISAYRAHAAARKIWLLVGSFGERIPDAPLVHNTSVLVDPRGEIVSVYRKIHLFDADPPDGVPYRESASVKPGVDVVTADLPCGRLGLSICYDLRFPELYRRFSAAGASIIAVPSAFTVPTGQAHWEVLLRARAIENLSYVVAPAQVGDHFPGRKSYGRTLIVAPWGEILADAGTSGDGFVSARIDPAEVERARRMLPALGHRRL